MKFNESYEKTILSALKTCKRGFGTILKHRHPEVLKYIFELTIFLDNCPKRTLATRIWYVLNHKADFEKCIVCGKPVTKNARSFEDPHLEFCGQHCAQTAQQTREKSIATCLKNNGVECGFNVKDEFGNLKRVEKFKKLMSDPEEKKRFFEKQRATCLNKFGVESWTQTEDGKRHCRKNGYDRARVEKVAISKKKLKFSKILEDELVEPLFTLEDYCKLDKDEIKNTVFIWRCKKCGVEFKRKLQYFKISGTTSVSRCPICYPPLNRSSLEEKKLAVWISKNCKDTMEVVNCKFDNYQIINPYQLDIIIKDKTTRQVVLAVEYNGSRWHSLEEGKTIESQLFKTRKCEVVGIPLVHIYEDEWNDKEKRKKLENFLKCLASRDYELSHLVQNLKSTIKNGVETIEFPRDKFSKTLVEKLKFTKKLEIVSETEPEIILRKSIAGDVLYHVGNCGNLVVSL